MNYLEIKLCFNFKKVNVGCFDLVTKRFCMFKPCSSGTVLTHIIVTLQVFSRANEAEEHGWWQARVKMLKGEFAVLEFTGWDTTSYTDIVSLDRIRSINPK